MRKRTDLTIRFSPPRGTKAGRISIGPDGQVCLFDSDDKPILPEKMERTAQYARAKGPKIQSQVRISGGAASVGGLSELAAFEALLVVDTNTKIIREERVSAACFFMCRLVAADNGYRVEHEPRLNFYEFHDVPGNPESLAILRIANDAMRGGHRTSRKPVAFVSDCALDAQESVSQRRTPIYGTQLLPAGFEIVYASGDTGWEFLNKLIAFCDKQSRIYLEQYANRSLPDNPRAILQEDPSVTYRFMSRSGLDIVNPHIKGATLREGSIVRLYGIRKPKSP